ncbi:hypothetical protein CDIK_3253 [Cucumispora dikerogammari]|nr:hypothetical protein CDIK_3253 [Cucumispora dikerogammari]
MFIFTNLQTTTLILNILQNILLCKTEYSDETPRKLFIWWNIEEGIDVARFAVGKHERYKMDLYYIDKKGESRHLLDCKKYMKPFGVSAFYFPNLEENKKYFFRHTACFSDPKYTYSDTFIKRNGQWQLYIKELEENNFKDEKEVKQNIKNKKHKNKESPEKNTIYSSDSEYITTDKKTKTKNNKDINETRKKDYTAVTLIGIGVLSILVVALIVFKLFIL